MATKTKINQRHKARLERKTKSHQYPIRLSAEQYRRLKIMATDGPMSHVISKGIDAEWQYHETIQSVANALPDFDSVNEIEKWRT